MKKATLVLLSLVALVSVSAFGQTPANGRISLGFGVEGALPLGDFSNASNFGIGGMGLIAYPVDPNLTLTGKVGYMSFSSKASGGPSLHMIPVLVGARYFLMPSIESTSMRSYIAADAGIYNSSVDLGGGFGTVSSTKFGIAPTVGAQFAAGAGMNVDVHVNYSMIFTDPSSTSFLGFGIGLEFGM